MGERFRLDDHGNCLACNKLSVEFEHAKCFTCNKLFHVVCGNSTADERGLLRGDGGFCKNLSISVKSCQKSHCLDHEVKLWALVSAYRVGGRGYPDLNRQWLK